MLIIDQRRKKKKQSLGKNDGFNSIENWSFEQHAKSEKFSRLQVKYKNAIQISKTVNHEAYETLASKQMIR